MKNCPECGSSNIQEFDINNALCSWVENESHGNAIFGGKGFHADTGVLYLPLALRSYFEKELVNFDGDWCDSVMSAFPHILEKLEIGGILIIHDYPQFEGMVKSVHKFIKPKHLRKFTEEPGYSGIYYIKEEGTYDV